jgi:kynurenine formamidase
MNLLDAATRARVYDLGQPYFAGMPHFPTHPPFLHSLTRLHGDTVYAGGGSSASDAIAMSSHTGTHIDALNHFSCGGAFFGGTPVEEAQDYGGVRVLDAETIGPIVRRGVLLDIAGVLGVEALTEDYEVTPADLDSASAGQAVQPGDVVLLRTGWAKFFADPRRYLPGGSKSPGPGRPAAEWLSARRIFAAGSDTLTFEHTPAAGMPVHVHLLVECGTHIIEVLNLEELARDGVREFLFVAAPLKLRHATGAPLRPLALVG